MSTQYKRIVEKEEYKNYELERQYIIDKFKILEPGVYDKDLFSSILDKINPDYWIMQCITKIFDPNTSVTSKENYVNYLEHGGIKVIKYDTKSLMIEYNNREVLILDLCSKFKNFNKKDYNSNVGYYKKEVYIPILINKIKELKYKSKILIGYIKEETLNTRKMLSWIEIQRFGKPYVIDFTNNIVMDKECFYEFFKPEVLNEISQEEIINDEFLSILVNDLSVQYDEYLIFSQEFNQDMKKNKRLFFK